VIGSSVYLLSTSYSGQHILAYNLAMMDEFILKVVSQPSLQLCLLYFVLSAKQNYKTSV